MHACVCGSQVSCTSLHGHAHAYPPTCACAMPAPHLREPLLAASTCICSWVCMCMTCTCAPTCVSHSWQRAGQHACTCACACCTCCTCCTCACLREPLGSEPVSMRAHAHAHVAHAAHVAHVHACVSHLAASRSACALSALVAPSAESSISSGCAAAGSAPEGVYMHGVRYMRWCVYAREFGLCGCWQRTCRCVYAWCEVHAVVCICMV